MNILRPALLSSLLLVAACPDGSAKRDAAFDARVADAHAHPLDSGDPVDTFVDTVKSVDARVDTGFDAATGDAGVGDPDSSQKPDASLDASVPPGLPDPLVLLHLSDIHIGSGAFAVPALEYAIAEIVPAIDPFVTFATGDLVETGNNLESWTVYREHIDAAGFTDLSYIEVPGNHDIYLDLDLSNYLENTLAGRFGHDLSGLYHHETDWGRMRIVAANTVSGGNPARDSTGYLSGAQTEDLIAAMAADPDPVAFSLVLGHHPIDIAGLKLFNTDDELIRLLQSADALGYLYGHRHAHLVHWEDDRFMFAMARTLGNPGDNEFIGRAGFNILVYDDGPAVKGVPIDEEHIRVDWPVVLITRPANADLGIDNPLATPLARASAGHLLRAMVFSPDNQHGQVLFRVDDAGWNPMVSVGRHHEAHFETPDASSCTVEVQATYLELTASDEIRVDLE